MEGAAGKGVLESGGFVWRSVAEDGDDRKVRWVGGEKGLGWKMRRGRFVVVV